MDSLCISDFLEKFEILFWAKMLLNIYNAYSLFVKNQVKSLCFSTRVEN